MVMSVPKSFQTCVQHCMMDLLGLIYVALFSFHLHIHFIFHLHFLDSKKLLYTALVKYHISTNINVFYINITLTGS